MLPLVRVVENRYRHRCGCGSRELLLLLLLLLVRLLLLVVLVQQLLRPLVLLQQELLLRLQLGGVLQLLLLLRLLLLQLLLLLRLRCEERLLRRRHHLRVHEGPNGSLLRRESRLEDRWVWDACHRLWGADPWRELERNGVEWGGGDRDAPDAGLQGRQPPLVWALQGGLLGTPGGSTAPSRAVSRAWGADETAHSKGLALPVLPEVAADAPVGPDGGLWEEKEKKKSPICHEAARIFLNRADNIYERANPQQETAFLSGLIHVPPRGARAERRSRDVRPILFCFVGDAPQARQDQQIV